MSDYPGCDLWDAIDADRFPDRGSFAENRRFAAPEQLARRFTASAEVVTTTSLDQTAVVPHPVVGSVTVAVLIDVALVEATVHLLDLVAAVAELPPAPVLERVRDLLARIPDSVAFIDAITGRSNPADIIPLMR